MFILSINCSILMFYFWSYANHRWQFLGLRFSLNFNGGSLVSVDEIGTVFTSCLTSCFCGYFNYLRFVLYNISSSFGCLLGFKFYLIKQVNIKNNELLFVILSIMKLSPLLSPFAPLAGDGVFNLYSHWSLKCFNKLLAYDYREGKYNINRCQMYWLHWTLWR